MCPNLGYPALTYTFTMYKWPDKSTTSYDMLDFIFYKEFEREISGNWTSYIACPRHTLAIIKV